MSAPWKAAERRAAKATGAKRVAAPPHVSAPDLTPIKLPSGAVLGPECKYRARLPVLLTAALRQAQGYYPRPIVPVAILYERAKTGAIVALSLEDFKRLVGLNVIAPKPENKVPRAPKQLDLLDMDKTS